MSAVTITNIDRNKYMTYRYMTVFKRNVYPVENQTLMNGFLKDFFELFIISTHGACKNKSLFYILAQNGKNWTQQLFIYVTFGHD